MATVYGKTISSTWRSYLTYSVSETATDYTITVNDVGVDIVSSTYYLGYGFNDTIMNLELGLDGFSASWDSDIETDRSLLENFIFQNEEFKTSTTISKTKYTQSIPVLFEYYTNGSWIKVNKKNQTGTEASSAKSAASVTLTVPTLAKPTVSLIAERDSSTDSTVKYTATIKSFPKDTISNCKLTVNGTEYTLANEIVPSSGTLNIYKTLTNQTINKITATLVVTGEGGTSNTYILNIPPAFYTLDIGNKGKEIAFGQSAITDQSMIPSNGLFSCGMDADFQGNLLIQGNNLIEKLKNMLCTVYVETLTIKAGTFTDSGCNASLVGNSLYLYLNATAKSAITAGNISNQTMLTITFTDDRISILYSVSNSGGASGPNSQIQFKGISSGNQHTITVTLAAIAQNLAKGGVISAHASIPCVLNWDAY